MKYLRTGCLFVFMICTLSRAVLAEQSKTITISGAWALYPLAVRWAEEYQKIHPAVRIDVSAGGAGKGITDALAGAVELGMVSRDITPVELEKGALGFAVAKDAVVPVINARNPAVTEIMKKGLTRQAFMDIWLSRQAGAWGKVVGNAEPAPIRAYMRSDACGAAETWAKYLGGVQEKLQGVGVYGDPGIAEAVRRDPLGIGFNNVNFAYDTNTGRPVAGLAIVPIDLNENHVLDPQEIFYATREELLKAIADGRYPSPPARDLYFVSRGKPAGVETARFLKWVLSDGQKLVSEAGYINIPSQRIEEETAKLG